MRKSRITFDIETARVRTIVELLIDQVSNFSVAEITEDPAFTPLKTKPKSMNWVGPVAVEVATVMRGKADKEWHYTEFDAVAKKRGMANGTMSQVLSEMNRVGRVKRVRRGFYKLVTLT